MGKSRPKASGESVHAHHALVRAILAGKHPTEKEIEPTAALMTDPDLERDFILLPSKEALLGEHPRKTAKAIGPSEYCIVKTETDPVLHTIERMDRVPL